MCNQNPRRSSAITYNIKSPPPPFPIPAVTVANQTLPYFHLQIHAMSTTSPNVPVTRTEDLTVLSEVISKNVQTYLARLQERGYPLPNLQNPIPEPVKDTAAQDAKLEILRACEKLMALVQGPVEWFMFQNMAFTEPACVGLVMEMGIHEHIAPGPEPTSLDELVESTGASRDLIGELLKR
jgi:sterigmatocystin 8-O-methyltransferase